MSKKHGFRGTPIRPAKLASGMGRMFDSRGDPMVSPREGRENFGRNLETENPDFDRYFAEDAERQKAIQVLKPQQIAKGNAFRKFNASAKVDPQRIAANIVLKMNSEIAKAEKGTQVARVIKKENTAGEFPDNIPAVTPPGSKAISREKQTPKDLPHKSYIDFSGKSPPKEVIKNGKVYRRK